MSEPFPVEYFGGPLDGKCAALPSIGERVAFYEWNHASNRAERHAYCIRRVDGVPVRTASGLCAMDYDGAVELNRNDKNP